MPDIPPLNLTGTTFSLPQLYQFPGLYGPTGVSLEKVNGGLTQSNLAAGVTIKPELCVPGTWVQGAFKATNNWEIVTALQQETDGTAAGASDPNRQIILSTLTLDFNLEQPTRGVLFGWQALFAQKILKDTKTGYTESWTIVTYYDNVPIPSMMTRLPYNWSTNTMVVPPVMTAPDRCQMRYRWKNKIGIMTQGVSSTGRELGAGRHQIKVAAWCQALNPIVDIDGVRIRVPSASVWALPLR